MGICFSVAVFIKCSFFIYYKVSENYPLPIRQISKEITEKWHKLYKTKLTIVGGRSISEKIPFYSPDHPSILYYFNYKISPWISENRIKKEGIAIVCKTDENDCVNRAKKDFSFAKIIWHKITIDTYKFTYGFIPPLEFRK